MLAYSYHRPINQSAETPVLVFLHGLLGSGDDWQACIQHLNQFPILTLDLPGHGESQSKSCDGFDQVCQQVSQTIKAIVPAGHPIILIGYSLGGRIAMYGIAKNHFHELNLIKAIIEGGNFGLRTLDEQKARQKNDQVWAERFDVQPIERVLADWYQQAVFTSLNHEQRQTLIAKRSANLGPAIGRMLMATSLAKQPWLLPELSTSGIDIHYICGEKDSKFSQLAKLSGLSFSQIAEAGHNVHHEHPQAFAVEIINQFKLAKASD
ncbi:2-succinyl-6-hydroxy-2,4-cyclohexadiene-1-carboxylate synthase [Vibrio ponticus]|uniref:Putative 2-succinyl-6-hydroxy-2,4-cyclohexadiene-1-carboxylate synthase n=1 Tax=Vibrio ponticus TaxID=265668 RepID=A0A3N3DYH4_9VIBR|nr:2-succinyl-6-hydroxy-2,4-cyclohexadiene-1-carboxylate synthase [Vibrio ponticus]ROV59436.1 2-succinyl-6-hydroxy-2,4-cyclohexadiene-1-carboxylate synthase [Vibrio ponticus]